jgi:Aspartyl protease
MFNVKWSALASLFLLSPAAFAATHCPGNVASVPARHVAQYLNVVEVSINHTGPYPFLLDTGAQITSIDPALAAALQLKPQVAAGILGVASHEAVPIAEVDDVQVGKQNIPHGQVAIQSLSRLQAADPSVRGVLGGDFLSHFDVLIDQGNNLLCLGKAGEMRSHLHGEQLALAMPHADHGAASTEPLIIPVRLSGMSDRPLLLLLDSGANAPFLWRAEAAFQMRNTASQANISTRQNAAPAFTVMPPQEMRVGRLLIHQISFAAPTASGREAPANGIDGLLPTAQFRRVYIDYINRFVVLESW